MNKQREALDALEGIHPGNMTPMAEQAWNKAINAIREALVEPEPVSHHSEDDLDMVARKPLTDEDISAIVQSMSAYTWDAHMLARLIEKAHGICE